MEKNLWRDIDETNTFHTKRKFTTQYSKEKVIFSDVNLRLVDSESMVDFFIKLIDTY